MSRHARISERIALFVLVVAVSPYIVAAQIATSAPSIAPVDSAVVSVTSEAELQAAVRQLTSNTTIVLAPGTYQLTATLTVNGTHTNVRIQGSTGNRDDVVLQGAGMNIAASVDTAADAIAIGGNVDSILIADLTIRDFSRHAIALAGGTRSPHIRNVHLVDAGEASIRSSADSAGGDVNDGLVENSLIEYTTTAKDSNASGIDVHAGANWIVRHNVFRNIVAPAEQSAGPAIAFSDGSSGTLTEGNTFLNCSIGIAYGVRDVAPADHRAGIIRNNFLFRASGQPGGAAISVADSPGTEVLNNTVYLSGTYATPIEYRFAGTTGAVIANNLLDGFIWARDGATGTELSNLSGAAADLFVNAPAGDLHLAPSAVAAIDRGVTVVNVVDDWDGQQRPFGAAFDIGADEYVPAAASPDASLTSATASRRAAAPLVTTATVTSAVSAPAIDAIVFGDQPGGTSVTAAPISTRSGNELMLAFVGSDGQSITTVTSVSGAGLTWELVRRTNVQLGTAEIWRAFAAAPVTSAPITATLSEPVASSLTVVSFSGVDTSGVNGSGAIGATASTNAGTGGPAATLTTTRDNSWVFGVGNDWDAATPRTLGPNQTMVHQYMPPVGDTYWVQRSTSATSPSGTIVTISDQAPTTDRYNLAICEILGAAAGDTTPPAVSITNPANGATVSGNVTVSATASDNVAVAGVQFKLDGANLGVETTISPYTVIWNATAASNGAHTLTAVARDSAGNTTSSAAITVNVNNASADTTPPAVSITGPVSGATVSGTAVAVSATATDNLGVASVQFTVDGANLGPAVTASPYTVTWNTATVANGAHSLAAVARDAVGNASTSAPVTVTVSNALPQSLPCPCTIWNASATPGRTATSDRNAVELGVRFRSDVDGSITGVRFYKGANNTGTHVGHLWTNTGSLLATATFANETASGWQQVTFGSPIPVTANTVYVASYHTNIGQYGVDNKYFATTGVDTAPLHAPASAAGAGNGVYVYGPGGFPTQTYQESNYWVDVVFVPSAGGDTTPPSVAISAPAGGATVSGSAFAITATATDNVGVAGVQFKLDGVNLGAEVTASPYNVAWNTTTAANGVHTLTAVARDAAANTSTSAAVTVTVSNTGPLTTTVVFHASADHNNGVTSYLLEVFANGADPNTATPVASSDLGKPTPDANGDISVDRTAFFNSLPPGTYVVTVSAIGNLAPGRSAPVTITL